MKHKMFELCVCMLLIGTFFGVTLDTVSGTVEDSHLVGYWKFNEGSGNITHDSSGNGNDGIIYGNATWATGISAGAINFDGVDDYVEIPHSDLLTPTDAITISLWFKEISHSLEYSCLIYKTGEEPTYGDFNDRIYTLWTFKDNSIHFTSTAKGSDRQTDISSPANGYELNQFFMLTAVIDTNNDYMAIYINGNKTQEDPYLGEHIRSGNYPLRIGAPFVTWPNQYNFNGTIDEVRIYNRAFNDSEIQYLYHQSGENQPPVAGFTWTPSTPKTNQTITFNATASIDQDGSLALYEWDWNNDSVYDDSHTTPTITHSWSQTGSYPVILKVTDDDGAANTKTSTVTVSSAGGTGDTDDKGTPGFEIIIALGAIAFVLFIRRTSKKPN